MPGSLQSVMKYSGNVLSVNKLSSQKKQRKGRHRLLSSKLDVFKAARELWDFRSHGKECGKGVFVCISTADVYSSVTALLLEVR